MARTLPLTAFCQKTKEVSRLCRESDEPLFLEEPGAQDLVVMSLDTYQHLQGRLELYRLLDEAEEDFRQGDRGITTQELRERLSH